MGNSIGQMFRVSTYGESHGPALGAVVDGCPAGMPLDEADLQLDLDRRRPGASRFTTQRREEDRVEILSGIFAGRTTGTSIGLAIQNTDQRSRDYEEIKDKFRPGHADYTYLHKYGIRDYRGGGRASARETAMRVAAGAIAKKILRIRHGLELRCCLARIGTIDLKPDAGALDWTQVESNPFFCHDAARLEELAALIDSLRRAGDSIGAELLLVGEGMPVGLGDPVFDRLEATLAHALMSINAVRAVGLGDAFDVVQQRGSAHRDELSVEGFLSNHSGGVLGGISSGQPLVVRVAFKPTSSIRIPGKSVDTSGKEVEVSTKGRHDPCVALRAAPIVEAMAAIVIADHSLRQQGQNGATAKRSAA